MVFSSLLIPVRFSFLRFFFPPFPHDLRFSPILKRRTEMGGISPFSTWVCYCFGCYCWRSSCCWLFSVFWYSSSWWSFCCWSLWDCCCWSLFSYWCFFQVGVFESFGTSCWWGEVPAFDPLFTTTVHSPGTLGSFVVASFFSLLVDGSGCGAGFFPWFWKVSYSTTGPTERT